MQFSLHIDFAKKVQFSLHIDIAKKVLCSLSDVKKLITYPKGIKQLGLLITVMWYRCPQKKLSCHKFKFAVKTEWSKSIGMGDKSRLPYAVPIKLFIFISEMSFYCQLHLGTKLMKGQRERKLLQFAATFSKELCFFVSQNVTVAENPLEYNLSARSNCIWQTSHNFIYKAFT